MPIYVVPSITHPIYVEWKAWRHRNNAKWTPEGQAAIESVQRIAEHVYADYPCIVGHMIMMDDTEEMEKEKLLDGSMSKEKE